MGKRRPVPDGMDYVPIPGADPDLVFGVIRSSLAGKDNSVVRAVQRRLFPVGKPSDGPWAPTCYRHDVILPPWGGNHLSDARALCEAFEAQAWEGLKDLLVIVSLRFPETVAMPPTKTLHMAFEEARAFAYQRLCLDRSMAAVLAMHVPSHAGSELLPPHCHIMGFARTLGPTGFGSFVRPLATDAGRDILEREWKDWRARSHDQ